MNSKVISKPIYDLLSENLNQVLEEKNKILEEYFYDMTSDRFEFENLIHDYIAKIEDYMSKCKAEDLDDVCPFVLINSIVEVEEVGTDFSERFHIVSPLTVENSLNPDYASYLSPIGKALLLKKVGENVSVDTPVGSIQYIIKSIEFVR
ncbi:transcription elongation factor [Gottschalkia purinilytica]|uniref:Transcription elongation factor n=1 Tax=Gottschalkia purinilytica TaxID=1503 RepID=A0A0L0W8T2_GOTPU|nr:GreA/GreB family elongation factor [Gottschalkia purinilytica]KNF07856.1 transcription elongation factor [Gottschalkia purinilytica]